MDDREILCIHIGQAGIQIGSAVWELFRFEHELNGCGFQECYCNWPLADNTKSLFTLNSECKYSPRCIMVDSEPNVIDEIRMGANRRLFNAHSFINGNGTSAAVFGRGYNIKGNEVMKDFVTFLRSTLEESNSLNGFLIFHSLGGGTGSGLTSRLTEKIQEEAPRKPIIHLCIASPSVNSGFSVEPYNNVLSLAATLESSSLVCMMQNNALYKSCETTTSNSKQFTFTNINRKIAQITSSLTTSYRFSNTLSSDFCIFQTNLIPFPDIHFPLTSYSPNECIDDYSLLQMTKSCFTSKYVTLNVDPLNGNNISCCLLYRGMNCKPMSINKAVQQLKMDSNIKFVDWCPTGFKIAINVQMPGYIPGTEIVQTKRSLCVLANNTAVSQVWKNCLKRFNKLFQRRAFRHWFELDGIDESMLLIAKEKIVDLMTKYNELSKEIKETKVKDKTKPDVIDNEDDIDDDDDIQSIVTLNIKAQIQNFKNKTQSTNTTRSKSFDSSNENVLKEQKNKQINTSKNSLFKSISSFEDNGHFTKFNTDSEITTVVADKNQSYFSSTALADNLIPKLLLKSKLKPFSSLLHLSILDLSRYNKYDRQQIYQNPKVAMKFLAKYRRLNSSVSIVNDSIESHCIEPKNFKNSPLDSIESLDFVQPLIRSKSIDFNETEICFNVIRTKCSALSCCNLQISAGSMMTENDVTVYMPTINKEENTSRVMLRNNKESMTSKISKIFSRQSKYASSKGHLKKYNFFIRKIMSKKSNQSKLSLSYSSKHKLSFANSWDTNLIDILIDNYIDNFLN